MIRVERQFIVPSIGSGHTVMVDHNIKTTLSFCCLMPAERSIYLLRAAPEGRYGPVLRTTALDLGLLRASKC